MWIIQGGNKEIFLFASVNNDTTVEENTQTYISILHIRANWYFTGIDSDLEGLSLTERQRAL